MFRFNKRLSLFLVFALVVSSIGFGFGQMKATAYTDATGTGVFKVDIVVAAPDCTNSSPGTQSSFRLQFLNVDDDVVCATPDNAITGTGLPDPLESSTTTYTYDGSGGNVAVTVPSLADMTVNKTITKVQLVNTTFVDEWAFENVKIYYSPDGGISYTLLTNTRWTASTAGAAVTWSVGTYFTATALKTLSFDANGGSGGGTYDAIAGQTIEAPAVVTREGYALTRWSPSVPTRMPNSNTTYTAQWTPTYRNITFDANGGTGGTGPTALLVGTTLVPPTVTKAGYTFITWSPSVPATVPAIDQTYTAVWLANGEINENIYNIIFDSNGGSGSMPMQGIAFGQTAALTNNSFAKSGYAFFGWATSPATAALGVAEYTDGENYTIAANDVTLYAVWKINSYTITFNANGGNGGESSLLVYGTALSAPVVTRTGYTFASWSPALPSTVPSSNTTYTAEWTPNTYTVLYNANSGSGTTSSSSHTYDEARMLNWNNFTRTGYTFAGWSTSTSGSVVYLNGQSVSNLSSSNGATVTLYATWTASRYTIKFDANGGTGGSTSTKTHATTLTAPTVTRSGFTFKSWSPTVPSTVPAADVTYTAQWNEDTTWTITFDANGGSDGLSTVMESGSVLTAPTVAREGYTFVGWTPAVPSTSPAADVTYTAQWSQTAYAITFDANGGTGGTSTAMVPGEVLSAPTVTRTGYTFAGWSPEVPSTVPTVNTAYIAQWTGNSYTITFYANGGEGGTSSLMVCGTPLSAPTVTKTGYTCSWSPVVPSTVPAANTTYNAQWTVNIYTISYDANGGSGSMSNTTNTYDTAKNLTANSFNRNNYGFSGWNTAADGSGTSFSNGQNVINLTAINNATVVLYAQWSPLQYYISYNGNGATGGSMVASTHSFDTPKALTLNGFTKTGYTFAGWATSSDGAVVYSNSQSVVNLTAVSGETITLYAKWTPISYNIQYNANGGTGTTVGSTHIYDSPSALTINGFIRTGYTFAGWSTSADGSVVFSNSHSVANLTAVDGTTVTLYANWTANSYIIIFDANGGVGGMVRTVAFGEMPIAPVVTRTNYLFTGWAPELIAVTEATMYTAQWIMLGDLSASNTISSLDALMVLQYVAGLTILDEQQLLQADVDMNGVVNNIDALKILQFASEIILVFT